MINIHYLQHIHNEGLGSIADWIHKNAYNLSVTQLFHSQLLPDPGDIDFLIIMGGPMGIYEEEKYPWLKKEKIYIEQVMKENKKVLGICLGAQLIADVLGAKVYPNKYKEIGWFPVQLAEQGKKSSMIKNVPSELMVFHWHSDTFELPEGAIHLFESEACKNQGFQYGENIMGLQFHLEVRREDIEKWLQVSDDFENNYSKRQPYVQKKEVMLANSNFFSEINQYMKVILNSFL